MKLVFAEKHADWVMACLEGIGLNEVSKDISRYLNRYGKPDTFEVDVDDLDVKGLEALHAASKSQGDRGAMMQIASYRNIMANPDTAMVGNLKALVPGLVKYLERNAINGWLFHQEKDGVYLPWLVTSINYENATQHAPAGVSVRLMSNSAKEEKDRSSGYTSFKIYADSISKRTIPEILEDHGYFHENQEFIDMYETDVAAFAKWRLQFGCQFRGTGKALFRKNYHEETVSVEGAKLVNDEEMIERTIIEEIDAVFFDEHNETGLFRKVPLHCRLFMFHLAHHKHLWVHVSQMKEYVYDASLGEKLILPELHRDLLEILTSDMSIVQDDIVEGKSGGTTILCKGAPGLGKTLTAECFSEIIQRPLYRVHSGQLGIDAVSVENALETILRRAERWNAILLLDEADVFVRERDNDMRHNAIVASFLRTLEYFSGILFMTTNRSDDIDDGILSRCIAVIKYETPGREDARKIWKVLSSQFDVHLEESLIDKLLDLFPNVSGRDIKELLKLTSKFVRQKKLVMSVDIFRQCAMFRGLV